MLKVVYVWCVISRGTVLKTCGVCNEKLRNLSFFNQECGWEYRTGQFCAVVGLLN